MILKGKAISPGVATGPAYIVDGRTLLHAAISTACINSANIEIERLKAAKSRASAQLQSVERQLETLGRPAAAAIFFAHAALLNDPSLFGRIDADVRTGSSAEAAVASVVFDIEKKFLSSNSSMLHDKASDIIDIGHRLLQCLTGGKEDTTLDGRVVVADSLTPSELIRAAHSGAVAIVVNNCGPKSHTAILARGFALPLVSGVDAPTTTIDIGSELLVDGDSGRLFLNPTQSEKIDFESKNRSTTNDQPNDPNLQPVTTDGTRVSVLLNISDVMEARAVAAMKADGVGLYRTEFLYLSRISWPEPDEISAVFTDVADEVGDCELNIRLADFGAEKCPSYADFAVNRNPSLGIRGVRLLMSRDDIFKPHVQALMQLAERREITVLLPMIDTIDMLRTVTQRLCRHCRCRKREDLPFKLSAMVEVPSAALMIEEILDHVDAVSIGLNDLTQYLLAADRDDELVESYHDALQPAVLRLVHRVITAANAVGKPVTMCGELAGDPILARLLLGMGARRFSVSQSHYYRTVTLIRSLDLANETRLAESCLALDSRAAIFQLARSPVVDTSDHEIIR